MFRFKATTFIIHAASWLLFLILPLVFLSGGQRNNISWVLLSSSYYWLFCLTYMVLFYFNVAYLIPRFFLRKKYLDYGIGILILLSCVYFLQPFDKLLGHHTRIQSGMDTMPGPPPMDWPARQKPPHRYPDTGAYGAPPPFGLPPQQNQHMHNPPWEHAKAIDIISLALFVIIAALGLSVRMVQQWQTTEQKVIAAEAGKANAELSFLKARINPHFLFNTLNNIYTLSVTNSVHTSESIMKLSNIMRYVTDEVTTNLVPLQTDLECISNYIDLQRLRLGHKTHVEYLVSGPIDNREIAPLILMSFVENAFKYGISKQENSTIKVEIKVNETEISFYCENKVFFNQPVLAERTGIGIANTKQRLQHLYPNKHLLTIEEHSGMFKVKVILHG